MFHLSKSNSITDVVSRHYQVLGKVDVLCYSLLALCNKHLLPTCSLFNVISFGSLLNICSQRCFWPIANDLCSFLTAHKKKAYENREVYTAAIKICFRNHFQTIFFQLMNERNFDSQSEPNQHQNAQAFKATNRPCKNHTVCAGVGANIVFIPGLNGP